MADEKYFPTRFEGDILVVMPTGPISNLSGQELQTEWEQVVDRVHRGQCRHVLVDMEKVTFFGSVFLGALNAMWKEGRQRGGRLVLCNLSPMGSEIIHATKFDALWEVYATREDALKALAS